MNKRAALYVRTSSEKQADKISPQAQETDCRDLCARQGYEVVQVYRDTEKYRAGSRLVEPSGTRADRPALRRLLADARADQFDVLVAWREDRLYRSYRPMLDVLECIEETGIEVELAKESFDRRLAPVKAWAAKMELDARHDRFIMGFAGRFHEGKAANHPAPYGYMKDKDGFYQVNMEESEWVARLFAWYAEGVSIPEIRRRFVTGGAPQRRADLKYAWHQGILRRMLNADYYWTGKHDVDWGGEVYGLPLPPIIERELAEQVQARKAQYQFYPAGNNRNRSLAGGLVYCTVCNVRCNVSSATDRRGKNGNPRTYIYYQCSNGPNVDKQGHFKRGRVEKIDAQIWERVWLLISQPGTFEEALRLKIEELQAQEADAEAACTRMQHQLEELNAERQKVITWARKEVISEADLGEQLFALSIQERALKQELAEKSLLLGNRAERLIQIAEMYRHQLVEGLEAVSAEPETVEGTVQQFKFRKDLVEAIVDRVDVHPDQTVTVHACITLSENLCISDPAIRSR